MSSRVRQRDVMRVLKRLYSDVVKHREEIEQRLILEGAYLEACAWAEAMRQADQRLDATDCAILGAFASWLVECVASDLPVTMPPVGPLVDWLQDCARWSLEAPRLDEDLLDDDLTALERIARRYAQTFVRPPVGDEAARTTVARALMRPVRYTTPLLAWLRPLAVTLGLPRTLPSVHETQWTALRMFIALDPLLTLEEFVSADKREQAKAQLLMRLKLRPVRDIVAVIIDTYIVGWDAKVEVAGTAGETFNLRRRRGRILLRRWLLGFLGGPDSTDKELP